MSLSRCVFVIPVSCRFTRNSFGCIIQELHIANSLCYLFNRCVLDIKLEWKHHLLQFNAFINLWCDRAVESVNWKYLQSFNENQLWWFPWGALWKYSTGFRKVNFITNIDELTLKTPECVLLWKFHRDHKNSGPIYTIISGLFARYNLTTL